MVRIIPILLLVVIAILMVKVLLQLKANNKLMKKASKKPFEDEIDSYGIRNGRL